MLPELVVFQVLNRRASKVEKQLLMLGEKPDFSSVLDGYSEFRAFTETELSPAIHLVKAYANCENTTLENELSYQQPVM